MAQKESSQAVNYYLDSTWWHRIDFIAEGKAFHFICSPDFYELLEGFLKYSSECLLTEELRQ